MDIRQVMALTYYRGRVGLHAILKALGIGPGDEVITQAFTCIAVPEAIMATGATPVYVDIEAGGVNMDPSDLAVKLTDVTRAIIVQHTFGIPADMRRLTAIAERAGLPVIEDCCHTVASALDRRTVGEFGVASFYSFEWGKPIVAGVGGAVLIRDDALRERIAATHRRLSEPPPWRRLRLSLTYAAHRLIYRPKLYWPMRSAYHALGRLGLTERSYNPISTADDISPEYSWLMGRNERRRLRRKLERVDACTKHARAVSSFYDQHLKAPNVVRPKQPDGASVVVARYPLFVDEKEQWIARARGACVEMSAWYSTPVHPLKEDELLVVHYRAHSCPNAEVAAHRIVSLPVHQRVSDSDMRRTVALFAERDP